MGIRKEERKPDFNTRQDTWPNKTPRYSVNNNMNTNNNLSNNSRRSGFSVSKPTSKSPPKNQQNSAKGRDSDKTEHIFKDKKSGSGWGQQFLQLLSLLFTFFYLILYFTLRQKLLLQ
jgi:hypothetical protein